MNNDSPGPGSSNLSSATMNNISISPGLGSSSSTSTGVMGSTTIKKTPSSLLSSLSSATSAAVTVIQQQPTVIKKGTKRVAITPNSNHQLKNGIGGGGSGKWEEKFGELLCPVCMESFKQPHITKCGHTYCHECILKCLEVGPRCPKCGENVQRDGLIPNFLLNTITTKEKDKSIQTEDTTRIIESVDVKNFMKGRFNDLSLSDVNVLLTVLRRKKESLTVEDVEHQKELVSEFLNEILRIKKAGMEQFEREIGQIQTDLSYINNSNLTTSSSSSSQSTNILLDHHQSDMTTKKGLQEVDYSEPSSSAVMASSSLSSSSSTSKGGFNSRPSCAIEIEQSSMASRRRRMYSHFEELTKIYLQTRNAEIFDVRQNDALVPNGRTESNFETLDEFGNTLMRISRYYGLKPLSTLSYNADLLSNSNIVSSIEFDKDNEFFAIAGVTRKIKLFEYSTVIGTSVDIHCPSGELLCTAKISCIAWSSYYKNFLASSDYDGSVCLWDASTTAKTRSLSEHEKRVWSVDWSNGDPRFLASGSDDAKVKLWSINNERSVTTLEAKANVCCVKFCPENSFLIAFGSADHCVHYYDFRHPREPLGVLSGHKKAVSYVKFASKNELVSASTDSHLKLWNLETMDCVRSFRGHVNEKNFVGLATDGNYIACGSENNSLYVYYKQLPKPLFSFRFDNHRSMLERSRNDESNEFVSAVAWKKGSPVVVAANSQGAIKILELV